MRWAGWFEPGVDQRHADSESARKEGLEGRGEKKSASARRTASVEGANGVK